MSDIFVESLEQRIAPASLIDSKTITYKDVDGDIVKVAITKGAFSENSFTFDNGSFASGNNNTNPQILEKFDLSDLQHAGTDIKITVLKGTSGDGLVNLGAILATGNDIGKVSVQGSLVKIEAGDALTLGKGMTSLSAVSLGKLAPDDFDLADRTSTINGKLGSLALSGDMAGTLIVQGGRQSGIGQIQIGGSLIAGAGSLAGWISSTGAVGKVTIGHDIDGRLADTANEAGIYSKQAISDVTVGSATVVGSIWAGEFMDTGIIRATTSIGKVNVTGDVGVDIASEVEAGESSGAIIAEHGAISAVTVGGDVIGGAGLMSGHISSETSMGSVKILGSIIGGDGEKSGTISTFGAMKDFSLTGSLTGGAGKFSGTVNALDKVGNVTIKSHVTGGGGEASGSVLTDGTMGNVTVIGNLTGAGGATSGTIMAGEKMGNVTIDGTMSGGVGESSGSLVSVSGAIGTVLIDGAVTGGDGALSGTISAKDAIKKVEIRGALTGGEGDSSGCVAAGATIASVIVTGDVAGGVGVFSGTITGWNGLGTVSVGGSLLGGSGNDSGSIQAGGQQGFGIRPGSITKVDVTNDVTGNSGQRSGSILAWGKDMKEAYIGGSITGGSGTFSALVYAGINFKKVTVVEDLIGGSGYYAGRIATDFGPLGDVVIRGELKGGSGELSGSIESRGSTIASVDITGGFTGGSGYRSGLIWGQTGLGTVHIGGDVTGGTSDQTGMIVAIGNATSIKIDGSVVGTDHNYTGYILVDQTVKSLTVGQDLKGGNNRPGSGGNVANTGAIQVGNATLISIERDIIAGTDVDAANTLLSSGAIRSGGALKQVKIGGSIIGNETTDVLITALADFGGPVTNNVAIGSISVVNNVAHALIVAGAPVDNAIPAGINPYARIGSVTVEGNWTASSIAAGVDPGANGYGSADDKIMKDNVTSQPAKDVSNLPQGYFGRIGQIVIKGTVSGGAEGEQYGFASANFGSVTIGGVAVAIPTTSTPLPLTEGGEVTLHRLVMPTA